MKKYVILCAALIVTVLLMLSTAAAAPLTTEEILARKENGEPITEEEAAEYLDSLDNMEKAQDLSLGANYTLDGRTIRLSGIPLKVSASDGSNPQTVYVQLENSYYKIADDVILVHDADGSLINGRPAAGTRIGLGSGIRVDSGSSELREGSKVLLLEKNGGLHAFYAGVGTDSNTLVTGNKLYIMRCFQDMQVHTPNGGIDIDIDFVTIMFPDGSGWIKAGEKGTLNINIDVDSEYDIIWFGPIPIPVWYLYLNDCSMGITLPNLTIHAERYAGWYSIEIPLVKIEQELDYGFMIDMSPTFSLEGEGEGDTVLSVSAREGFRLTIIDLATVTDIEWKHTDPTFELVDTDMEGELYYGFAWGPALTWVEVAGFGGFYKTGVVVSAGKSNNAFNPDNPDDPDWHVCGKDNCLQGTAFTRDGPFSANIVLVGGIVSIPIVSTDPYDYPPFVEYYISKTFGEKSFSSLCPHWAWRLNVQVVNQNITPIPNAKVYYKNVPEHYEDFSSATTDSSGNAVLCTTTGNIEVVAELANPDDPSHPYTASVTKDKKAMTETLVLELDLPSKYVYFKNSASGEATEWPEDISFIPAVSREVKLPDTVPELSGRVFTGWNTAEDGSGTSYNPGTKLTLSDDLTLWAQWQIAGDDWYVIYNANGGTKAPGPQIVRKGQDAVLTTELPENGKLIFKGWTPDLQTLNPVYQPGDILKYDSEKTTVVLYAVWDLSPVPQPIHISFEANGEETAKLPADIWCEQGTWIQLEEAVAPIGGKHHFLGWSEDPNAKEPEYLADTAYYFFRNTQLFAVWENLASMTLTFRDPLPDEASGMPDPITILPSMSRYVRIPSQIPQKSGRVFTGWNTMQDGSGTAYNSGSVITLWTDTVLWAQWKIAENDWFIVYDANGGTKAPGPQLVPKGQDAVLTTELPESESLTFKGWATDPDAAAAEYQPGAALRYDSSKNVVVLYALWELDPAKKPVIISFSSNGGRPDTLPKKITVPKGVWVRLPGKQPSWDDQHDFLGWSADPQKSGTQWNPGDVMLPEKDTILYAMWNAHYQVIEGAGSVWVKGSGKKQRFVADGALLYFNELKVDGQPFVDGVQISSGSTIADIGAATMEKLSVGAHTVTFVYMDGQASATFFVQSTLPPTGDTNRPALWFLLILIGVACLALQGAITYKVKRKKQ